jgi:hypothetical protein
MQERSERAQKAAAARWKREEPTNGNVVNFER